MKRPATKRTRINDILKAMEDHGKCFIDAAKILVDDFKESIAIDDDFSQKSENKFDTKIAQMSTQYREMSQ